jgi:hypothetical protein
MSQIKIKCPHCEQRLEFDRSDTGAVIDCPNCGLSVPLTVPGLAALPPLQPGQPIIQGGIIDHNENSGGSCLVQLIGLFLIFCGLFTFGITAILGIALVIIGGRMARKLCCSNCGVVVASRSIQMCPACHCRLNN